MKTVKMPVSPATAAYFDERNAVIQEAHPDERSQLASTLLSAIADRMQISYRSMCSYDFSYNPETRIFSVTEREYFWKKEQDRAAGFTKKKEFIFTFPSSSEYALNYTIIAAETETAAREKARELYGSAWSFCYPTPEAAGVMCYGLTMRDYVEA